MESMMRVLQSKELQLYQIVILMEFEISIEIYSLIYTVVVVVSMMQSKPLCIIFILYQMFLRTSPNQKMANSMSKQMISNGNRPVNKLSSAMDIEKPQVKGLENNQKIQYFSFPIKQVVNQADPTLAFNYDVPSFSPNQKSLNLVFQQIQTTFLNFSADPPSSISIGLRNFAGFIGKDGVQTNKVCILNLAWVGTNQQMGTRDIVYKSNMTTTWNLGSLRQIQLQLYVDQQANPIPLPLINPLSLAFKVVHVMI